MTYSIQQILNALQLGSIYALIALGYTMVYGILSIINFAHGDLFMVGAFFCFLLATKAQLGFVPTLILVMAGTSMLGMAIERFAYRPLRAAPRVSAIITALGVGIFLENFTLALSPYPQQMPMLIPRISWSIGGVSISLLQILVLGISLLLMFLLDWLVRKTMFGMAMRAISWDRVTASLMGIPVGRVISQTFALGAALGGAAGMMYALAYPVIDPYMGVLVGWKAFISAVVGGIGNIRGAVLGGFILAGVEIFVTACLPSTYRDFIVFGLLLILLVIRPHGILGKPKLVKV